MRFAYWTILIGDSPTAFRAKEAEELRPTLVQLRRKHPEAVLKWFQRGRLWNSPDEAAAERRGGGRGGETRTKDWRPGGKHVDPKLKYQQARKAKWTAFKERIRRPYRRRGEEDAAPGERERETRGDRPFERPFDSRGGDRPFKKKPYGDRPAGAKPFGAKPFGDKRFSEQPSGDKPFGARPPRRDWREDSPAFDDTDAELVRRPRRGAGEEPAGEGETRDRPFGKPLAKKPFGSKPSGKKPFGARAEGGSSEPDFEARGDKPFGKRAFADKPFTKKPFGKPFGARPEGRSSGRDFEARGDKPFGKKPFGKKPFGKPFGARPEGRTSGRDFEARSDKPFGKKPFEKKPFGKPFSARPQGRTAGRDFEARGDKPFGKKPFAKKPFGSKPGGDSRAGGGATSAAPFKRKKREDED